MVGGVGEKGVLRRSLCGVRELGWVSYGGDEGD